jgi:uncharacterized protein
MPIFRLEFADGSVGRFDSDTTTFWDGDRELVIEPFDKPPTEWDNRKAYTPEGLTKSDTPRFVRIVFGFNCNMHCKYCSQANTDKRKGTSVQQAVEFAKCFCEVIKGDPKRIELWGGEPLVYWKHIKAIMPILKARFPKTLFGIITNGTLVTREIIDFIDRNNMSCVLSYDGPGQYIRGEDVLADENKRKLWLELYHRGKDKPRDISPSTQRFAIASTITRANANLSEIVEYDRKMFGDPTVPVFHDYVTAMGGILGQEGYESTSFRLSDCKGIEAEAYRNLDAPDVNLSTSSIATAQQFIQKAAHHAPTGTSICGSDGDDCLFVKIDGTVMQCQNNDAYPGQYGSLFDLSKARVTGATMWQDRETCSTCPFAGLCRGACPFMKGNAFASACAVKGAYYRGIFRWVVERTFGGKKLVAIHGDMKFPALEQVETPHGKINHVQTVRFAD